MTIAIFDNRFMAAREIGVQPWRTKGSGTMGTDETGVELTITDMSCGSCVRHVTEALSSLEGVQHVDVSLEKSEAAVEFDGKRVGVERMVAAVEEAGYHASEKRERHLSRSDRQLG